MISRNKIVKDIINDIFNSLQSFLSHLKHNQLLIFVVYRLKSESTVKNIQIKIVLFDGK